ncbi:hypothetical protein [Sinomonas albida]|uniref:hypothetical protein n=1 Tax=Sinomonas albida TaxID=369942 RepID=UPI0030167D3E
MSKIKTLRKALEAAEAGGNVGAIIVAKQALQLGITKKLLDKVNATEADGASQIDGDGYGDGNSRTIPGTNTIQSPAVEEEVADDEASLAQQIQSAHTHAGEVTKAIAKRIADTRADHARQHALIKKQLGGGK